MSEYAYSRQEQPMLDGLEVRRELERMTPLQLREEKVRLLSEMSERESLVHAINDVLEGYGEVVEDVETRVSFQEVPEGHNPLD